MPVPAPKGVESAPTPTLPFATTLTTEELLPFRVVDAGYSESLDRMVLLSDQPPALYLYDPLSHASKKVALPGEVAMVSVAADGKSAAVLHRSRITLVDLEKLTTVPVTTKLELASVVLAGDRLLGFPVEGQHALSVDLKTHAATQSNVFDPLSRAVYSALTHRVYAATRDRSPADVGELELLPAGAVRWHDSAYHGQYAICGDVWASADGLRLFDSCATSFRISDSNSVDLTFNGEIPGIERVQSLAHSLARAELAVIPGPPRRSNIAEPVTADTALRIVAYDGYGLLGVGTLPQFQVGGRLSASHGRAVFAAAGGNTFHILVEADPAAGLVNGFAITTLRRESGAAVAMVPTASPPVEAKAASTEPAFAPPTGSKPESPWNGISPLSTAEKAALRGGGRTPTKAELERYREPKPSPVLGGSWEARAKTPPRVDSAPKYDMVHWVVGGSEIATCVVSVTEPDTFLRDVARVLPQSFISSAYVRDFSLPDQRRPIFTLALSRSRQGPLESDSAFVAATIDAERAAVCAHRGKDGDGFFWAVALEFLQSLHWTNLPPKVFEEQQVGRYHLDHVERFRETITFPDSSKIERKIIQGGDVPVGFDWTAVLPDGNGLHRVVNRTLMIPANSKLTALQDVSLIEEGDKDGILQHASWRGVQSGSVRSVTLTRVGPAKYELSSGSGPSSKFATDRDILDTLGKDDHQRLARATKGAFDYVLPEVVPEVSTSKVTFVHYARGETEAVEDMTLTAGNLRLVVKTTVDGRLDSAYPTRGPQVHFDRAFRNGSNRLGAVSSALAAPPGSGRQKSKADM
ncbi:MAG: hypothetical protein ABI548_29125 [Polyangiaceae bacterium]